MPLPAVGASTHVSPAARCWVTLRRMSDANAAESVPRGAVESGRAMPDGTGCRPRRALVIVGKAPRPGHSKTRLCPPLTPAEAAALSAAFLLDSVALGLSLGWEQVTIVHPSDDTVALREVLHAARIATVTATSSDTATATATVGVAAAACRESLDVADKATACVHTRQRPAGDQWDADRASHARVSHAEQIVTLMAQSGDGLRDALCGAFTAHFGAGFEQVVLIGSDSPTLPCDALRDASRLLADNDIVIGPSRDGGYYLIGMTAPHLDVFDDITWSSSQVYAQTVDRARRHARRHADVRTWYDVDEPADLDTLHDELELCTASGPRDALAVCAAKGVPRPPTATRPADPAPDAGVLLARPLATDGRATDTRSGEALSRSPARGAAPERASERASATRRVLETFDRRITASAASAVVATSG